MTKNQIDMVKLGKLIEKCSQSGVKEIELVDLVRVKFGDVVSYEQGPKEPEFLNLKEIDPEILKEQKELEQEMDKMLEEEMLHLTDPTAWQENLLKADDEKIMAYEGDQDDEL
jgi:hypothetical protein